MLAQIIQQNEMNEIQLPKDPWPIREVMTAVELAFPARSGQIVCKFLWEKKGLARYRANWLSGDIWDIAIKYSAFVEIYREIDGLVVIDRSMENAKQKSSNESSSPKD